MCIGLKSFPIPKFFCNKCSFLNYFSCKVKYIFMDIFAKGFFPRNGFPYKCLIQKFKHLNSKCLWFFFISQLNKIERYRKHIQARHSCVRSKIRWAWDQRNKMRMLTKMHYNTGILFPKLFWHTVTKHCSCQESRREGWTDALSAVGFCLGSGLFGSYNSD